MDFFGIEEPDKILSLMTVKEHEFYALKMGIQKVLGRQKQQQLSKRNIQKINFKEWLGLHKANIWI